MSSSTLPCCTTCGSSRCPGAPTALHGGACISPPISHCSQRSANALAVAAPDEAFGQGRRPLPKTSRLRVNEERHGMRQDDRDTLLAASPAPPISSPPNTHTHTSTGNRQAKRWTCAHAEHSQGRPGLAHRQACTHKHAPRPLLTREFSGSETTHQQM